VNQLKVLILFGGSSTEHEVSIKSARNIAQALNKQLYEPILVGISKDSGTWYHFSGSAVPDDLVTIIDETQSEDKIVNLNKVTHSVSLMNAGSTINLPIEFVLPILHGKYGEDGCLQGLLKVLGLPFAGCAVASSAVCMDKDFTKRILSSVDIPICPYLTVYAHDTISYEEVIESIGVPFFVKPANTGSSVGVYKIKSKADFEKYIPIVFQYDEKAVLETYVPCREIECAILGNGVPQASVLGEIKPTHDFYSYEAKYIDPNGADLIIPAALDKTTEETIRNYALKAYKVLGCKGFSRVDFFVTQDNQIFLNEINTIPGFTNISMYPKLFETCGINYTDLISKIIECGLAEYEAWTKFSTEHILT